MIVKVKVFQKETHEGKKFNTYKAVQKNGTLIDLRFTQAVKNLPSEDSILEILDENINLDTNRLYPCLWCKKIERLGKWEKTVKVDPKLHEAFKYDDISEDDLPF